MERAIITLFYLVIITSFFACNSPDSSNENRAYLSIDGRTMGTTYNVQYDDSLNRDFKGEIDSILKFINKSMSTYDPNSTISKFNYGVDSIKSIDSHFEQVFKSSEKIYKLSGAYFNPSVFPLVKYWGFVGGPKPTGIDSTTIDSLLNFCDFETFKVFNLEEKTFISREKKNVQLDFSAVAKGYAVDIICNYIKDKNINNYLVEIGGEVRYAGLNPEGKNWSIGIDYPIIKGEKRKLAAIISSGENSIATSGNYRNFYIKDGKRYAHILNPNTGYSYSSNILSATVVSENCAEADALATALMIGGETLMDSLEKNPEFEILLIKSELNQDGEEVLTPIMSESLKSKVEWLID